MEGLKVPHNPSNPIVFLDIQVGEEEGNFLCLRLNEFV